MKTETEQLKDATRSLVSELQAKLQEEGFVIEETILRKCLKGTLTTFLSRVKYIFD